MNSTPEATLFILPSALLAFAALSPAAPVPKTPPVELYFPTTVGTKWTEEAGKRVSTCEITGVDRKEGTAIVTVEQFSFIRLKQIKTTYKVAVSEKGVFLVQTGETQYDPPHQMLKLPFKEGGEWDIDKNTKGKAGKPEVITVKAGRFLASPVIVERKEKDGSTMTITHWFVPDVGIVRLDNRGADGVTRTAEEMTEIVSGPEKK